MRMSCNGCRVLRKGCDKDCSIRPCLDWIKSSGAQSNATLFLAKFYGRAGLVNLINAGPLHLRPSIFRSLLYEACGRIVNPIYGSAGLFSTGSWQLCQTAVENVLSGSPITQAPIEPAVDSANLLFKACDIRHVAKQKREPDENASKIKNRTRFKRSTRKSNSRTKPKDEPEFSDHNSVKNEDDAVSVETVENMLVKPNGPESDGHEPELGLGLSLFPVRTTQTVQPTKDEDVINGPDADTWKCDLTLGLPILS